MKEGFIMAKKFVCSECGDEFTKGKIDWEVSDDPNDDTMDEEYKSYYCKSCASFLSGCGIDAMDPDGFGYDEYGVWDEERLGF